MKEPSDEPITQENLPRAHHHHSSAPSPACAGTSPRSARKPSSRPRRGMKVRYRRLAKSQHSTRIYQAELNRAHRNEWLPMHTTLAAKILLLLVSTATISFCIAWVMSRIGLSGWISLPIVMIVFAVIGHYFARYLTYSLTQIRDAAENMAQGNYHTRVEPTSTDEVGELAISFNRMSEELEHADQMRKDMIANVSHELRTPVAVMQAQAENMADGVVEASPANLEVIVTQTHRLSDLIAFLLDLSRMEAGAASLDVQTFSMADFLDEVVEPLEIADASHNHEIEMHVPPDLDIEGDRQRLSQLFTNIINNALKHSPDDTHILIDTHYEARGDEIVTNVVNFGSYIDPAQRETIFRRFAQGEHRPGTSSGGTGLGLSIARWAARLHGGSVRVVDDPRGANFEIRLPRIHQENDTSEKVA